MGTLAVYSSSMFRMRTAPAQAQAIWLAVFALLLAFRLLSPAGFMPAFDHGAVTIIACPDAVPQVMTGHAMQHHHGKVNDHQPCPYASGASIGSLGTDFAAFLDILIIGAALLLGRTFLFIERHERYDRPPTRGPPIPA